MSKRMATRMMLSSKRSTPVFGAGRAFGD